MVRLRFEPWLNHPHFDLYLPTVLGSQSAPPSSPNARRPRITHTACLPAPSSLSGAQAAGAPSTPPLPALPVLRLQRDPGVLSHHPAHLAAGSTPSGRAPDTLRLRPPRRASSGSGRQGRDGRASCALEQGLEFQAVLAKYIWSWPLCREELDELVDRMVGFVLVLGSDVKQFQTCSTKVVRLI